MPTLYSEQTVKYNESSNCKCILYYRMDVEKVTKIDVESISSLNIPELRFITENSTVIGVRGRTLSAPKRRWVLPKMKAAGIETIIDLRAGDHSDNYPVVCEEVGLEYFHFPIDRSRTPDAIIIAKLPDFIRIISNGGFYISCALGLHRTDIALSLYYLFNPKAQEPPVLYGQIKEDGTLKYDDIFQRVGSVYHYLTEDDKDRLGWDDSINTEFVKRKKNLLEQQKRL